MRRKLTTIVAADMVGYSRLLTEDESSTLSALELLRSKFLAPKAEFQGGRIFRFLGDGTLLEFDSALGAVEFSIDLQRSLAEHNTANPEQIPILLRVGINLGDVVIEKNDIHGDGVNIAVRLEALSDPGGICLADSVFAQTKSKIASSFVSMGTRSLKNIADPVQVWRWRRSAETAPAGSYEQLESEEAALNGHHVLDPRLTDLLLRLHARSSMLALSNALDAIVGEEGEPERVDQLYYHIGEQLHTARALLYGIKIERVDNHRDFSTSGGKRQTLGEFVASTFNDSKIGFAFKIIPEAQAILGSNEAFVVKRKRFMELVRQYLNDDFIASQRSLIAYAYID